jgi:Holliday junction resolvase
MSGRKSKDKGYREENGCERHFPDRGFQCMRVPLSGAVGGSFAGDIILLLPQANKRLVGEIKIRADGFKQLYGWLVEHDFLIVRADRREALMILPLNLATELLDAWR